MLQPGTLLQDRFVIEQQIGHGGMGAVYMAVDKKFGSKVAIKETFYSAELADAFEREARLLNGLHHPVLPHVSDYFSEGDEHFLVMEYIEGEDLSEMLRRGETLVFADVTRWTLELLDALDYLHSQDPPVIHRDVKPNNLKITSRGNIVLLDFGLAKETSGNTLGMNSVFGYSRRYSPLEQIEGTGTDTRSDLFALGATVFHLLTGAPPIDAIARASAIVAGRPDPLRLASDINPAVPPAFSKIIHSSMALNPEGRFVSAGAMKNALEFAIAADTPVKEAPAVDAGAEAGAEAPEVQPQAAAVGSFAALEAFKEDTDPQVVGDAALGAGAAAGSGAGAGAAAAFGDAAGEDDPAPQAVEPIPAFTEPADDTIPVIDADPVPPPAIFVSPPAVPAEKPTVHPGVFQNGWASAANSFRHAPLLWLVAILAAASIITYGVYRSSASATTGNETQTAAGQAAGSEPGNPLGQVPATGSQPAAADTRKETRDGRASCGSRSCQPCGVDLGDTCD